MKTGKSVPPLRYVVSDLRPVLCVIITFTFLIQIKVHVIVFVFTVLVAYSTTTDTDYRLKYYFKFSFTTLARENIFIFVLWDFINANVGLLEWWKCYIIASLRCLWCHEVNYNTRQERTNMQIYARTSTIGHHPKYLSIILSWWHTTLFITKFDSNEWRCLVFIFMDSRLAIWDASGCLKTGTMLNFKILTV